MKINSFIRERLFNLKNEEKKKFDASLLPTLIVIEFWASN